jgi:hypothetical protein
VNIKHDGQSVDVKDARCATRSCLRVGVDHGVFAAGRGYTRYHDKPRFVCMTRHLHGCPQAGVCEACRSVCVEGVTHCEHCGQQVAA